MGNKKFEPELLKKFDRKGKSVALDFLESTKKFKLLIPLDEQKERYKKWDFIIKNIETNRNTKIECEVKSVWKETGCFPYETVHVPHRKKDSKANIFIMVNNKGDSIFVTKMSTVKQSKVITKFTRNRFNGTTTYDEPFFELNLTRGKFYTKDKKGKWRIEK